MCIIDKYYQLKKGQIWIEVSRFLEQNGVNPLGMDGEVIYGMIQQHRRCAMSIKKNQEKILKEHYKKESVAEQESFTRLRRSNLSSALEALKEIDYIRKTTDKEYKDEDEKERRNFIEKTRNFSSSGDKNYHRINYNFMTVLRQNYTIRDIETQDMNVDQFELMPVSPTNSDLSYGTSIISTNNASDSMLYGGCSSVCDK
ncbi:uncharacterized protein LOC117176438 [Belonocnema kinseyi]|uniref:uncharacterized protein LOC117176438 n=1 Tax=Belonocnema kinseyi TaxID=2817044 RepID=UPI00143D398A|nr:uncharacterized protein LOC117176438 [Belonocnema kinseyi]